MDPLDTGARGSRGSADAVRGRSVFLDVARGWAMVGVIVMNALTTVAASTAGGGRSFVEALLLLASELMFSEVSRTLLAVMLGIGMVLMRRAAVRRGRSSGWLLVRRYVVLFLVVGLANSLVTEHDVLALYSLVALAMVPLLPWLLNGPLGRPFVLAIAGLPLGGLQFVLGELSIQLPFALERQGPIALIGLATGIWLTRLPEFNATNAADASAPNSGAVRSRAVVLATGGLAAAAFGMVVDMGGSALFFSHPEGVGSASVLVGGSTVTGTGRSVQMVGQALLYLGVIWWLVERARSARVLPLLLGVLVPIGRMSLTVYLGSAVGFVLLLTPVAEEISILGQLGVGMGYLVLMAVLCSLWLRAFRYGPVEWVWRCLTYLRPLPLRRRDSWPEQ